MDVARRVLRVLVSAVVALDAVVDPLLGTPGTLAPLFFPLNIVPPPDGQSLDDVLYLCRPGLTQAR